jgi:hypothetical protein
LKFSYTKNNKKSVKLNEGQILNDYLKCCKTVEKVLETKKPTTIVAGFVLEAGLEPARTLLFIGF